MHNNDFDILLADLSYEVSIWLIQLLIDKWPPWGPGGLSRECVLRIPMRVVKGD